MSEKVTVFEVLALISCGIIIGGVGMAFYYVPAYYDMQDQRDMYRTDSRDAIIERDELRSQVEPLNVELRRKTVNYDELRSQVEPLNTRLKSKIAEYEELRIEYNNLNTNYRSMTSSHDRLNNEYSSLVDEYNDQVVILNDVNALSRQQQQQLNSVSGLMQDSYNRGYNDASMGDDDGIGDLLELLILFI